MNWNIAQAKQRLSEVIRAAGSEPQIITNRNTPVAAVIAAEELAEYRVWKNERGARTAKTLGEEFAELRQIAAGAENPLPDPDRFAAMRPNAIVDMMEEEAVADATR